MTDKDLNTLRKIFGIEPIPTTGIGNGVILKLPDIQIKIYDGQFDDTYQVQAFDKDKQVPFLVKNIPTRNLKQFLIRFYYKGELYGCCNCL